MTLRTRLLSLLVAAGLAGTPAGAFVAQNSVTVRQLDSNRFEVLPRGGLSATDAWCAAGDFVLRVLQQPGKTQIWRISEPPRGGGQSIVFSLSSEGAASSSGLSSFGGGVAVTASHGQDLCWASIELRRNK